MNNYKKLCTEFYDIDKPNAPGKTLKFYLNYIQQAKGLILEPMCGTGRFLLPLLESGFSIDGVDASHEMLQACRKNAQVRGLSPNLFRQFLHELNLPNHYDLVMIPAGSFCLITDPHEIHESIIRLYEHMNPGAKFVLEIEQLASLTGQNKSYGSREINRTDGGKIVFSWFSQFNPTERVSHSQHRYELIRDGQLIETEYEEFYLRYYEITEFRKLLESAGFTFVKTINNSIENKPCEPDDNEVFECVKL